MQKVIILGSTGSIGRNTLAVLDHLRGYQVVGLAAYGNYPLLVEQTRRLSPKVITIINENVYKKVKRALPRTAITCGEAGIAEMVKTVNADIIVCALATSTGIKGIMQAIRRRMRICLATKEILVSFGSIVMSEVHKNRTQLFPIDSEHSAIYQCLEGRARNEVMNIILTASGGPFLHKKRIKGVRKDDVLKHPIWKMGAKITVDSATMMNKGLEVIEAHHLFNMPAEKIQVVIHPEALCHSLVQFIDGTLIAQFSHPDMKLPIQYALTAPRRAASMVRYLDMRKTRAITFIAPQHKKYPCLALAYHALDIGRSMPAVLNAANDEAVNLFLKDKLSFHKIPQVIEKVMEKHTPRAGSIDQYIKAEQWAREQVQRLAC